MRSKWKVNVLGEVMWLLFQRPRSTSDAGQSGRGRLASWNASSTSLHSSQQSPSMAPLACLPV